MGVIRFHRKQRDCLANCVLMCEECNRWIGIQMERYENQAGTGET